MVNSERRKWLALGLLAVVQFMVVLDIAIVNVALPSIKVDLGFSQQDLQWVISAYALFFGGFLLLGGRAADLLGRRRLFLIGLVVFTVASLFAGLAWSEASLIVARSAQGLGAAIVTPAALSILMTTFSEGRERNIALGVWGAVGGFGAAAGVLLGGILTDLLSWEWIFFLNVPVGVAAFILAPLLLNESRDASVRSFDAVGAVLVTGGLSSLVYAITQAGSNGWVSTRTVGFFVGSAVLLAAFGWWETRHPEPLMRFGLLRTKTVAGANVAGFIMGTALFAMFLMLTLYMQQVLGYSPLKTGVGYLAVAGTAILTSIVAAQLVTRLGVKPVLIGVERDLLEVLLQRRDLAVALSLPLDVELSGAGDQRLEVLDSSLCLNGALGLERFQVAALAERRLQDLGDRLAAVDPFDQALDHLVEPGQRLDRGRAQPRHLLDPVDHLPDRQAGRVRMGGEPALRRVADPAPRGVDDAAE